MNKQRRDEVEAQRLRAVALCAFVEELHEQERAAFDTTPEGLQASERGAESELAADALERAASALHEAVEWLEAAASPGGHGSRYRLPWLGAE